MLASRSSVPARGATLRWIASTTLALAIGAAPAIAEGGPAARTTVPPPEWVQRSNANAMVLMQVLGKFAPEQAGVFGAGGLDEEILDLKPNVNERMKSTVEQAVAVLQQRRASEQDPAVLQDLDILIARARQEVEGQGLREKLELPYIDVAGTVFQGLRALLDAQVAPERRGAALRRLNRYAGLEKGYEPIAKLAQDRIRERLSNAELVGPVKAEVERDLANQQATLGGIQELFTTFKLDGWQKPIDALKQQLDQYAVFIRAEVLPRARSDFREYPELYAFGLRAVGSDMPVDELQSRGRVAFREIQNEMQSLAPLVARAKSLNATDYRDVIRELKKHQLEGRAILPHYEARVRDLERLITANHIATLPQRPMQIRLASEAA